MSVALFVSEMCAAVMDIILIKFLIILIIDYFSNQ